MRTHSRMIAGLLVLSAALLGYGIWSSIRIRELSRVEAEYKKVQARLRIQANVILSGDKVSMAELELELLRERLGVPPSIINENGPQGVKVNAVQRLER